jgi:hypothetical protein
MKTLDGGTKKRPGRRTLCTPEKTKELCKLISHACTIRTACEASNVSESAFNHWIRRGEAGEKPFSQFAAAITRARGKAKVRLVRSIANADDWRAKLELLARVYPSEYARTEPRVIVIQQPPPPPMPPPVVETTHEWHKGAEVPPELVRYLDLLQRTDSISTRKKMSAANRNGDEE